MPRPLLVYYVCRDMKREILSFDLTGTLATFKFCDAVYFEGLPRLYAERHGTRFEEAQAYLKSQYDTLGEEIAEWYDIKYWFNRLGLGEGWTELLRDFAPRIEFYPEAPDMLERYSREYELILITNAGREFMEIETAPIKKYFARTISCVSDFGEVKKTPDFYGRVCRSLGREPEEITHVGDHWQFDFIAPRGHGLRAFYLDRTGERDGEHIVHDLIELETRLI